MSRSMRRGVDQAEAARLAAEPDVLGDGALGQQVELLEHRGEAGPLRLDRVAEPRRARRRARRCRRRPGGRRRGSSSASTCRRRSRRPGRGPAPAAGRGRPRRSTTWPAKDLVSTADAQHRGGPAIAGRGRRHVRTWHTSRHFCREFGRSCLGRRTEGRVRSLPAVRTSDVFELLRDGTPRTRAQLAQTPPAWPARRSPRASTCCCGWGWWRPTATAVSTGGRPPSLLALNPSARVVAGVDIGASHATVALADLAGTVLAERRADLDVADGPRWCSAGPRRRSASCWSTAAPRPAELIAIGVGLPGPVEHASGRAINPPIMPGWDRYDVPAHVRRAYDVAGADRQRRQHHGAGRAARPPARRRRPRLHQGQHRHRRRHHVRRRSCSAAPRAPRATSDTCGVPRRGRRVPLRQPRLPRGGGGRAGARRARCATQGADGHDGRDVVELGAARRVAAVQAVRQAGRDLGEVSRSWSTSSTPRPS